MNCLFVESAYITVFSANDLPYSMHFWIAGSSGFQLIFSPSASSSNPEFFSASSTICMQPSCQPYELKAAPFFILKPNPRITSSIPATEYKIPLLMVGEPTRMALD